MEPNIDPLEERLLRRIPIEIIALAAFGGIVAAFLFDFLSGAFFFGGGLVAALSFLWLKRALGRILAHTKARALRSGVALYALRFALILGAFLLIIFAYPRKITAFAAGFSTVLPVFAAEAAFVLARAKSWKV